MPVEVVAPESCHLNRIVLWLVYTKEKQMKEFSGATLKLVYLFQQQLLPLCFALRFVHLTAICTIYCIYISLINLNACERPLPRVVYVFRSNIVVIYFHKISPIKQTVQYLWVEWKPSRVFTEFHAINSLYLDLVFVSRFVFALQDTFRAFATHFLFLFSFLIHSMCIKFTRMTLMINSLDNFLEIPISFDWYSGHVHASSWYVRSFTHCSIQIISIVCRTLDVFHFPNKKRSCFSLLRNCFGFFYSLMQSSGKETNWTFAF